MIVVNGAYEDASTLNFYGHLPLHVLNSRENGNLYFGSLFPDSPAVFEDDASLDRLWRGGGRVFLFTPAGPDSRFAAADRLSEHRPQRRQIDFGKSSMTHPGIMHAGIMHTAVFTVTFGPLTTAPATGLWRALLALALLGTVSSTVFLGLVLVAAVRNLRLARAQSQALSEMPPVALPAVTVFKPLHGAEPRLEENLESFSSRTTRCLRLSSDAAMPAIPRLRWSLVSVRAIRRLPRVSCSPATHRGPAPRSGRWTR